MPVYSIFSKNLSSFNWNLDIIKCCLLRTEFVPDYTDINLLDALKGCEVSASGYERQTLVNKITDISYNNIIVKYKADDITFVCQSDGGLVDKVLIYKEVGDDINNIPILVHHFRTPRNTSPVSDNTQTEIQVLFGDCVFQGSFLRQEQIILTFPVKGKGK